MNTRPIALNTITGAIQKCHGWAASLSQPDATTINTATSAALRNGEVSFNTGELLRDPVDSVIVEAE